MSTLTRHLARAGQEGVGRLVARWACTLAAAAPLAGLGAGFVGFEGGAARSSSGQFVARSTTFGSLPREVMFASTNRAYISLDPALLSVSAERIKQLLWRELGYNGNWQSKIYLSIRNARGTNDPVLLVSDRFRDAWTYGVELPKVIGRQRYVRAITQVVLLEMANRNAQTRGAEIPVWLVEGLAETLLARNETEIILTAPTLQNGSSTLAAAMVNARRENPLKDARAALMSQAGLSFQQLSWPSDNDLVGEKGDLYRSCAHLFVSELLALKDGPASTRTMLASLPEYLNWQFAFLKAFASHFQRPLDIEKWWSLQVAHFAGRDLAEAWQVDESWMKLDEILGAAAEIRSDTNSLPKATRVTVQVVVRDWKSRDQDRCLGEILTQLQMLRLRSQPEFSPLVDDYTAVIQGFMQQRARLHADTYARNNLALKRLAASTVAHLDQLDARRQALQPRPANSSVPVASGRGL